ncbi:MAG TPA: hypothetical protein PKE26_05275 [Kiritimatiellia bacterium]|nr:hypothetical protein [Kiritimatiellia bacterium]HMO98504.1 hypothetical protein [Kiritimatiellia bacterium]HMP95812.1 hypothetical protein [Kiritimatiellia bacterium]
MKSLPVYTMDYELPPENRWDQLPSYLRKSGAMLAKRGVAFVQDHGAVDIVASLLRLLTKGRNPYRAEIKAASRIMRVDYNTCVVSNYIYEIQQIGLYGMEKVWNRDLASLRDRFDIFTGALQERVNELKRSGVACTAGARIYPGIGMVHVRSMDWPLGGLGRHSLLLHHVNNPAGDFYSIGWPGCSGVLSGFKPGRFSATINQAFMYAAPNLQWPPAHLLRWVFEHCHTFTKALETLRNTPVCVPAFILLASSTRAVVVEMGPDGNTVVAMKPGRPLVIANDYLSRRKKAEAKRLGIEFDSDDRRDMLGRRMLKAKVTSVEQGLGLLKAWPVEHEDSMQQMAFAHGPGHLYAVGREEDKAVASRLMALDILRKPTRAGQSR